MGVLLLFGVLLLMQTGTAQECSEGDLQLMKDSGDESHKIAGHYIEHCVNGTWYLICKDTNNLLQVFIIAEVACRQLGYRFQGAGNQKRKHTPPFFIRMKCNGTENSLQECDSGVLGGCNTEEAIWAVCQPANCKDEEIRLVSGSTNREGRVEVCINGRWGTVCSNNQGRIAGDVCSKLGFPAENATQISSFGPGSGDIYNCSSSPTLACDLSTDNCNHSMDIGVRCQTCQQLMKQTNETQRVSLGAVGGVLAAVLLATVVGWVCTCVVVWRRSSINLKHSSQGVSMNQNESYSLRPLQDEGNNEATNPQANYSTLEPHYDQIIGYGGEGKYDHIEHSQHKADVSQSKPAEVNPTPMRADARQKEDKFYDAEQHTYAAVNINHKKKAKKKCQENNMDVNGGTQVPDVASPAGAEVELGEGDHTKLKH